MYAVIKPVFDTKMPKLCKHPYPNHPKGCPNWGKKKGCPPNAPWLPNSFDYRYPVYAIWNVYPFGEHVEKMRAKHPEWTQRQVECCLYWQGTARKQLKEIVKNFLKGHPGLKIVDCPEAQGINLTETMKQVYVQLEWPPKHKTYQIVLAGTA